MASAIVARYTATAVSAARRVAWHAKHNTGRSSISGSRGAAAGCIGSYSSSHVACSDLVTPLSRPSPWSFGMAGGGAGGSWCGAALAGPGSVRGEVTKATRKKMRKKRAAEIRRLLQFAERYDPMRKCWTTVQQTLKRMNLPFTEKQLITEGCYTMFGLVDQHIAVEVVSPEQYVSPQGGTPLQASEDAVPKVATTDLPLGSIVDPPVLDEETQAKHDLIAAKGWDLIVIHQPEWAPLCERPRTAHVARRDYILQRILLVREQGGDDRWQLRQPEDEEEAAE